MKTNPGTAEVLGQSPFKGMLDIWHYNRPQYINAAWVILLVAAVNSFAPFPLIIRRGLWVGCILAAYWSLASLVVSHWVYDRSELMRLHWLEALFPQASERILNLHAGVDDSSVRLREIFHAAEIVTADFFDAALMNEPSIHRARKLRGADPKAVVSHRRLPYETASFHLVSVIFAAHELRTPAERRALLGECRRVLLPEGRILVVEHLRDVPNFIAFGPGFLHFHSAGAWKQDFAAAGLHVVTERSITPFVGATLLGIKP